MMILYKNTFSTIEIITHMAFVKITDVETLLKEK